MSDTYIVAEIGTAHQGDLKCAKELIQAARESGADCAKFQYVIADELVHPRVGSIELPGGLTSIYDRFRDLEQPASFYEELMALCASADIDFLCTAFGIGSARALRSLGVGSIKVASPEANHTELLNEVATYGIPTILSTGVSSLADIDYSLSVLGRERVTVLHCVTAYPAPENDYNIAVIPSLSDVLGVPVGLSDHSQDPVLVPGLAVAAGAVVVEKHFTLSRKGSGLDDPIAQDPTMFTAMAAAIRRIDAILNLDPSCGREKVVQEFRAEYGTSRIENILGSGAKDVAPAEQANYATTRRSIIAMRDLAVGQTFRHDDVAALRAEKNMRPGIEPRFLEIVRGAVVAEPVRAGEGVVWSSVVKKGT